MAPGGVLLDGVLNEQFERSDLPVERLEDAVDAGFKSLRHDAAAIFLGGTQRCKLAAAHD